MIQRSNTNIFIAHTPLQNFIASKIVHQFFSSSTFHNIIYTSVAFESNDVFDEHHFIDKENLIKKIFNTYRAKINIVKKIKHNPTAIFIAHTSALLDNYFYYSFTGEQYGLKINFFYEGVLYFYEYHQDLKNVELKKRKFFGLFCNIKYQISSLIFPADDDRINCIYSILPEFTLGPISKIKKVNVLKEDYESKPNAILILGGKPSLLMNSEVVAIYEEMIKYIQENIYKAKVYFKGHHADTSNNFEKANNNKIEVIDITQNKPIEEVIELYSPSLVLSYPSSGLINLKAMYGDKMNMISYYIENKKSQINYLDPVFNRLKIKLMLI